MNARIDLALAGIALAIASCSRDVSMEATVSLAASAPSLRPDPIDWNRLATRRIFFAHQSVGADILEGIRELTAGNPAAAIPITTVEESGDALAGGILESSVGENGDPASKLRAFAHALDGTLGELADVALVKFCFLDMQPATDPAALFAEYRDSIAAVRARHPGLTIVHVTMPLTTAESSWKRRLKGLLGRPSAHRLNAQRGEFNRHLVAAFAGREPVFDLARVESTRRDGSRVYRVDGRDTVYTLAPEYTEDGGHLNTVGRRAAASELLRVLSAL